MSNLFDDVDSKTAVERLNNIPTTPKKSNIFDGVDTSFVTKNLAVDPKELAFSFLESREEDPVRGFAEFETRVPSTFYPNTDYLTKPRPFNKQTADIRAMSELNNNLELYEQLGISSEFEKNIAKQNDSFGFDTVTEPIFDALSIGNYSTAAFVEEMLLTGDPHEAFKQMGIEVANSLSLADNFGFQDQVRRTSWGDIFSGKRGETAFTFKGENSKVNAAAAGFVFDILLDPTTWFGYGLLKVTKGVGKLDELAGPVVKKAKLSHAITESVAGRGFRKLFVPNGLVKGLRDGESAQEIAEMVTNLNKDRGIEEVVTAEQIQEASQDFLSSQIRKDAAIAGQQEALRENILKVASDMNEGELRLIGAFLDQPKVVDGLIKELKVDDNTRQVLKKGVDEWRDMFDTMFEAEQEVGLFDKAQFRANYSVGTEPVTEFSKKMVEKIFEIRFGKDVGIKKYNEATKGVVTITDNGVMKSSYQKSYPTLESRLMDLVNTETNVALMSVRRGMESIRKVNTQKFYNGILTDTRIAVPIDQVVAEDATNVLHTQLKQHGMRIWKAPALSTKKVKGQKAGDEPMYYALPAAMVDNLEDMNKIFTSTSENDSGLKSLVRGFREVQGLWKAYALMSPGYHARNLYSNIFNNYLAGVKNPKAYAEAMLLQVEDTANIGNRKVRSSIERLLGGRKSVDDYTFKLPDGTSKTGRDFLNEIKEEGIDAGGLIYSESDLSIGKELMTSFELRNGRPSTTDISDGLQNWGNQEERVASVASNILNAAIEAGSDIDAKTAQATAEMYDVAARAWAWRNWKTPEDWYTERINQFRAYAIPKEGAPDDRLDFLFQKAPVGNIDTPEFKEAIKGAYAVHQDGTPIRVFHGTRYAGNIAEEGFDLRASSTGNLLGNGIYVTEDIAADVGRTPQDLKLKNNPSPDDAEGVNIVSNYYSDATKPLQRLTVDIERSVNAVKKYGDEGNVLSLVKGTLSEDPVKRNDQIRKAYNVKYRNVKKKIESKIKDVQKSLSDNQKKMNAIQSEKDLVKRKNSQSSMENLFKQQAKLSEELRGLLSEKNDVISYSDRLDDVNRYSLDWESMGQSAGIVDGYTFIKNPFVLSTKDEKGARKFREMGIEEEELIVSNLKKMVTRDLSQLDAKSNSDLVGKIASKSQPIEEDVLQLEVENAFNNLLAKDPDEIGKASNAEDFYFKIGDTLTRIYNDFDPLRDYDEIEGRSLFNYFLQDMGYDGLTHADTFLGDAYTYSLSGKSLRPTGTDKEFAHQVFVIFDPKNFKSTRNKGTWDLSNEDMLLQMGEGEIQGAIQFYPNGKADILATAEANPTTFVHEMGHLIRRTMLDENDKQIIQRWMLGDKEYNSLYKEARSQAERAADLSPQAQIDVDVMTAELMDRFSWTKEGEEFFAKAFEQYIMEGVEYKNMPSPVKGTFDFMKESFRDIYDFSNKGSVGIKPNDDVRHVLERVLGRGVDPDAESLATPKAILQATAETSEPILRKAQRILGDNYLVKANRAWGERLENNARIAHYIHMRTNDVGKIQGNGLLNKKAVGYGMNATQAADSVRRYLFDYGELTPFERNTMRTIIPFYTWMRKNIPLQYSELVRNPERYSPIPKTINAIETLSEDQQDVAVPDYFSEMNAVRLPFDSGDIPLDGDGMPLYAALDLPFQDLNRLNMKDMVGSMSPFLKTWAEIYPNQGYSFFLDSPIESFQDEPSMIEIFDNRYNTGLTEKEMHTLTTLLPLLGKGHRLVKMAGEGRLGEQLLREVAGINVRAVDPDAQVRAELYKRVQVSRALNKRIEKLMKLRGFDETLEDLKN